MFAQKLLCGVSVLFLLSSAVSAADYLLYQADELEFKNEDGTEMVYTSDGKLFSGAVVLPELDGLQTKYFYKDGKKNGVAVTNYENEKLAVSTPYKNGLKDGRETAFFENEQPRYQRTYKDGILSGIEIVFNENGKPQKQGNYVDGQLNGEVYYFDENGNHIKTENYEKGIKQGIERVVKNNSLMAENNYVNGRLHGVAKKFSEKYLTDVIDYVDGVREGWHKNYAEDGTVTETPYHNDMKNGDETVYYPNKKPAQKTHYINDLKNGLEQKFREDGSLISAEYYVNDKLSGISGYFDEQNILQTIKYYKDNKETAAVDLNGENKLAEIYRKYKEGHISSLLKQRNLWYDTLWLGLSLGDSKLFNSLQNAMKMYTFKVDDMEVYRRFSGNNFEKQQQESFFGLTPLTYAVVENLPEEVLQSFAGQIATANPDGKLPLQYAVQQNNAAAVKCLLDMQTADNASELYGLVLYSLKNNIQPEIIKTLLEKLPTDKKQNKQGEALFEYAAKYNDSPEVLEVLLKSGIKVDTFRKKLLNRQLQAQKSDLYINTLLRNGFDAKALDESGKSALYYAAINDYSAEITEALAQQGAVWTKADAQSLSDEAIKQNNTEYLDKFAIPEQLWNEVTADKRSALQYAYTQKAKPEILQYFIDKGTDINHQDSTGNTLLLSALQGGDEGLAEKLLNLGAAVNLPNENDETALTYALTKVENEELKNRILHKIGKDDVTLSVGEDKMPLWKYLYQTEDWELFSAVLKFIDNPLALRDEKGQSLAGLLSERQADAKQEELLKTYIPQSDAATMWDIAKSLRTDLFTLIPEDKLEINKQSDAGETLLTYAVQNGADLEFIEMLINKGADVNLANSAGQNGLDIAISQNNKAVAELLVQNGIDVNKINNGKSYLMNCDRAATDLTDLLLGKGADVSFKTADGVTTLMAAVQNLNLPLVKAVLEKDTDVNLRDKEGNPALFYLLAAAEKYKNEDIGKEVAEILRLLAEHGADLNHRDDNGQTILIRMAQQQVPYYAEFEQVFTAAGGNKELKDQYDKKAADYLPE